jgi:hypothetical protein
VGSAGTAEVKISWEFVGFGVWGLKWRGSEVGGPLMPLKTISNFELRHNTKTLVKKEVLIGIEVLQHLREIDSRKSFAQWGYSNLYSYCTEELKYSRGSAHRRIASMKLLREVPELEPKIESGELNVSPLSQAHTFFNQEERQLGKTYSTEEKKEILSEIEGKSSDQTERLLKEKSPEQKRPEKKRAINAKETEIRFTADQKLMEKLERLKNLMGHKSCAQTYAGLFEELADLALKKLDPMEKPVEVPPLETGSSTRTIPTKLKRAIWQRDQGQCSYVEPESGKRCTSKHALQYEHIIPFGKGGQSSFENLKLLCQNHNRLTAIQVYGLPKMQKYWSR